MPQRHSKNNNDLGFFTYDEKRKLGYGTQRERLGKDSIKPFDACCLCLKPFIEPMSCLKGHVFCKECILEGLLSQKKDIQRKLAAHASQRNRQKQEHENTLMLQKARDLNLFDQQNHSAIPHSIKTTSYESETLRSMKAFWLPSATPEAYRRLEPSPSTDTVCPEGNEKLRLKSLFRVHFTEYDTGRKRLNTLDKTYICPSCKVTLTNTASLVALSSCGHVFCKKCADNFVVIDRVCLVCDRPCKEKNRVGLSKGGTGFAGHGDCLEAVDFRHLGSGTGLGLVRNT
ncbi:hypothetical protein ACP275_08G151200 [Erythranthe tilingii]